MFSSSASQLRDTTDPTRVTSFMQLSAYSTSVLKRDYIGQDSCSVARTLEIIGDRWTWLLIRDAFLGLSKFAAFRESLGIAPNVLHERLARLAKEGIFERVLYCERPARFEYRLTQKGSDLFTALNALRQWGDQYLCAEPMRLLRVKAHRDTCDRCARPGGNTRSRQRRDRTRSWAGFPPTSSAFKGHSCTLAQAAAKTRGRSRLTRERSLFHPIPRARSRAESG